MKSQKVQIQTVIVTLAIMLLFSLSAFGQVGGAEPATIAEKDTNIYTESVAALTKLFVLAVLVESALSLIFNWRIFLEFFNKRAIKTVVMFVVSLTVVRTFDIDIVAELMKVYDPGSNPGDVMSTTLTALIVAGGSSGVNNLFIALGFRSRLRDQAPQPPRNEAWIAILVHRDSTATGEVLVQISEDTSGASAQHDSIAGSVNARKKLRDLFFPNRNRFPTSGGYKVESGKVYKISVSGKNESGAMHTGLGDTYSFAPRAIIDLDVKL
ncbi:MAG: hypothetical protein KZQ89_15560 [Candidatus Thiodiazotropha sp. (ex Lucinoma kastoroae)]|nr:hypothetical protein [Candidatus Thiodiazotropha sp. (ex Lucinoma kastoroae)]MCU7860546.1 hypothetical protein [Candidatus Thiodiazotropha sp. (ex Lucinoma kastoroae)]